MLLVFAFLFILVPANLCQLGPALEVKKETAGRGIVITTGTGSLQLLLDLLSKNLAQFNTPLVEGVNVPDCSFGEGNVFVVGNQSTQSRGCDLLGQNRGRRSVSKEGLVRHQVVWCTFGLDLLRSLADHQSLGLGKEVGSKHALVLTALNRIMRLHCHNEVGRDKLGALVEQLEETVLGIGGRLAKQDGAGGVLDVFSRASDRLAIALHGKLLQIGRESVQVLVEGSHQMSLGTEEVTVPDTQQATQDRDVLLQGSFAEVLVHSVSTGQELVEVVETDVDSDRETNGTPHGVTATNPGLEAKHVLLANAKLGDLSGVGREGDEMLSDMGLIPGLGQEPGLRRVCIGRGFGGGERLGGN